MSHEPDDAPVLDALARSVPQVAPPADLRARVLAAAVRDAATPASDAAISALRRAAPRVETRRSGASRTQVAPASRWPWGLAAAAALVAVTTSWGWISARGEIQRLQQTIAELNARAAEFVNVRAEFAREETARDRAATILSADDVTSTVLAGVAPVTQARARAYVSRSRGLLFAAEALPPAPAGRTYQLWTIVGGQPVSHGVFDVDADGHAQVVAQAPPGPHDAVAVTIEPTGGVPSPTGDKVLLGVPSN